MGSITDWTNQTTITMHLVWKGSIVQLSSITTNYGIEVLYLKPAQLQYSKRFKFIEHQCTRMARATLWSLHFGADSVQYCLTPMSLSLHARA